jgi:predicted transposase YdaD
MLLWLRFLKEVNEDMRHLPSEMQENEFIRHAADLCMRSSFTPEELDEYDRYKDIIRTERTLREGARREGLAEGLKKGRTEGEQIGLEKGEQIGLEKGRTEGEKIGLEKGEQKKAISIAQNLLKSGIPIEIISKSTGLPKQQIEKLIKNK